MTTPQYGWDTDFYSPAKNSRKGHAVKFQNSEHISHLLGSFRFVEHLKWWVGGVTMGQSSPVSVCETLQTKVPKNTKYKNKCFKSEKYKMKLQHEQKKPSWASSVCVTIDHFRRLRARLRPGVCPWTTRKRRRKRVKTKVKRHPGYLSKNFHLVCQLKTCKETANVCLKMTHNHVEGIHTNRYLQTLKTGSALSGFEVPCLVLKLMLQNVSIELCKLHNIFWHLILMYFLVCSK